MISNRLTCHIKMFEHFFIQNHSPPQMVSKTLIFLLSTRYVSHCYYLTNLNWIKLSKLNFINKFVIRLLLFETFNRYKNYKKKKNFFLLRSLLLAAWFLFFFFVLNIERELGLANCYY